MSALTPFFFSWVDADQTTFTAHQEVVDEEIFAFEIKHDEGQTPTLDLTIKNPRIGLLAPGRKQWAWLAYQPPDGSGVVPLFFGVLIGVPSDLFAEKITLRFISRSRSYIADKQAVAETMKVRPYWDPVFLDVKHRDDPDSILEGWSSLWHIDRTTLATTASDILTGEDGTIVFEEEDALYNNVSLQLEQPPLTNIQVQATVNWTQRCNGFVSGPDVNLATYTGESFLSQWPKPGAGLGSGWFVETSFADDVYRINLTSMWSYSHSWSTDAPMLDCSTNSMSASASGPSCAGLSQQMTWLGKAGYCNPYDDPPANEGASANWTGMIVPLWWINCTWELYYQAKRSFTENLTFNVTAHTQAILTAPTVEQNTELITITGVNVGEQLELIDAWTDIAGKYVERGFIIFPNNPTTPGGLSYQVCVVAGTAGSVEPVFSDLPGTITLDGQATNEASYCTVKPGTGGTQFTLTTPSTFSDQQGPILFYPNNVPSDIAYTTRFWVHVIDATTVSLALSLADEQAGRFISTADISGNTFYLYAPRGVLWASMGTAPLAQPPGWTDSSNIPLGEIIYAVPKYFDVAAGNWKDFDFGAYLMCISAGETNSAYQEFTYTPARAVSDEVAPAPVTISYIKGPGWTETDQSGGGGTVIFWGDFNVGDGFTDGSVTWVFLGATPSFLGIPAGGTPIHVTANNYFPTDRGLWSVEYLLCKARARLRLRSRAVKVSWECPFDLAIGLSCRMNATLYDPRLPGGVATGKVISYSLKADGNSGSLLGHVEIGCAVGYGETITAVPGTPEYTTAAGYMQAGYQRYDGVVIPIAAATIGYTPPEYAPFDDGLLFPLQSLPTAGNPNGTFAKFTLEEQAAKIQAAMIAAAGVAESQAIQGQTFTQITRGSGVTTTYSTQSSNTQMEVLFNNSDKTVAHVMAANPIVWEIDIKPVTNGPFEGSYGVSVSVLEVPKGIDLEAPSHV